MCSDNNEENRTGVQKVIEIREGDDNTLGDLYGVLRKIPFINFNAFSLLELVDWSDEVFEPPLTTLTTLVEVKKFIEKPM